jgi:hypothetical protein
VPSVTIARSDGGTGPVLPNTPFELQASVSGGNPTAWKWQLNGTDVPGEQDEALKQTASADTVGEYVAIATVNGENIPSAAHKVELKEAAAPGDTQDATETPERPPEFHPVFAVISAVVAAVVAGLVLFQPAQAAWDVTKSDWKGTDGHLQLAASLGVPLTVLGGAAVAVGAWMAAVEWRGRFKKRPKKKEKEEAEEARARGVSVDVGEAITAIGKLRGAALVLVVGAALMLGSAWIAKESAGQSSPTTTTPTTTSPATPGTTPPPPPPPTPPTPPPPPG